MTAAILRTVAARSDLCHSEISSTVAPTLRPVARSLAKRARQNAHKKRTSQTPVLKPSAWPHLAHKYERQRRAHRDQERPDKEFQPINRGHIARPQIVPTRHGGDPPSPWQSDHNAEPRLRFRRWPTIVLRGDYCFVGCGDRGVRLSPKPQTAVNNLRLSPCSSAITRPPMLITLPALRARQL